MQTLPLDQPLSGSVLPLAVPVCCAAWFVATGGADVALGGGGEASRRNNASSPAIMSNWKRATF